MCKTCNQLIWRKQEHYLCSTTGPLAPHALRGIIHASDVGALLGAAREGAMPKSLQDTMALLQAHEAELHQRGVRHVAVFGSVARGDARPDSDTDLLIELDPTHPLGLFAYASLTSYITDLVGAPVDVVNRHTVKILLRETIGREAVDVF